MRKEEERQGYLLGMRCRRGHEFMKEYQGCIKLNRIECNDLDVVVQVAGSIISEILKRDRFFQANMK